MKSSVFYLLNAIWECCTSSFDSALHWRSCGIRSPDGKSGDTFQLQLLNLVVRATESCYSDLAHTVCTARYCLTGCGVPCPALPCIPIERVPVTGVTDTLPVPPHRVSCWSTADGRLNRTGQQCDRMLLIRGIAEPKHAETSGHTDGRTGRRADTRTHMHGRAPPTSHLTTVCSSAGHSKESVINCRRSLAICFTTVAS